MSQSLPTLLSDLDLALANGDPMRHVRALKDLTSLFVTSADRLASDHAAVYDVVMGRLLDAVDTDMRAAVAESLAPLEKAPHGTMLRLARDEIAVAEPVLRHSPVLTTGDLAALAEDLGQGHLLVIAGRQELDPDVTDVLVRRGDSQVLRSAAGNLGARFSERGFGTLVERSIDDPALQQTVGLRSDLPPAHFKLLVERAVGEVRDRLVRTARPEAVAALSRVVANLQAELSGVAQQRRRHYAVAADAVARLGQAGKLNVATLVMLARSGRFEEVVCALSVLTRLSIDAIETTLSSERCDGVILICRAMNLDWNTACQLFTVRPRGVPAPDEQAALEEEFERLSTVTARRALSFMTTRSPTPMLAA